MPTAERTVGVLTGEWQSTGQIARQLIDRSLPHRIRADHHAVVVEQLKDAEDRGEAESRYVRLEGGQGRREWRLASATDGR